MNILKKFALLLGVCVAISFSHFHIAFAYPDCVAIITNYENIKNGIQIQRANGPAPAAPSLLYPGDIITGNVGYVLISRGPHADFHAVNGYYVISYDPPSFASELWENFRKRMAIFQETVDVVKDNYEIYKPLVNRSYESDKLAASYGFNFNPQPGFNTTLIKNEKVRFAGVIKIDPKSNKSIMPKSYVIKDSSGQEVYSGVFNKYGEAELDLNSQNFQVGEKYVWIVDYLNADDLNEYDFTILDEETTRSINDAFSKIDAKAISTEQYALEKAFLAQQISDTSDGKIDLYWLSAQLLSEISPKSDKNKIKKYRMLEKCHDHYTAELDRYNEGS